MGCYWYFGRRELNKNFFIYKLDIFLLIGRISKEVSRRRKMFGKGEKVNV